MRSRQAGLWISVSLLVLGAGLLAVWRSAGGFRSSVPAEAGREYEILEPGSFRSRNLQGGELLHYRIPLRRGETLSVVVDPHRVDMSLELHAPSRAALLETHNLDGFRGPLPLFTVAAEAGDYVLRIRSQGPADRSSPCEIRLDRARPASKTDFLRAEAWAAFSRGEHRVATLPRPAGAAEDYDTALRIWTSLGDDDRRTITFYRLGLVNERLGDLDLALELYQKALAGTRRRRDTLAEAITLERMGRVQNRRNHPQEALDLYAAALHAFRQHGYRPGEADALANTAVVLNHQGETGEAAKHAFRALDLWQKEGKLSAQALMWHSLGEMYFATGQWRLALDAYDREVVLQRLRPSRPGEVLGLAGRAAALWELGRTDDALQSLEQILRLRPALRDQPTEAITLVRIGTLFVNLNRIGEARRLYEEALAIAERTGDKPGEGAALGNLGHVLDVLGEEERALQHFDRAEALYLEAEDLYATASVLHGRALAQRDLRQIEKARATLERAIAIVEALLPSIGGFNARSDFLTSRRSLYELYIQVLVELGHEERAFEASEQARGRSLLEELAEVRSESRLSDPRLLEQKNALLKQLVDVERERLALTVSSAGETGPRSMALDREVRDIAARLDTVRVGLGGRPAETKTLDLNEIQKHFLARNELLLSYFLGETGGFLWAVTQNSFQTFPLLCQDLEARAREAHGLLAKRGSDLERRETLLKELADCVLPPKVRTLARGRMLVVSADGALRLIPFAALPVTHPLVNDHEIVGIPSASVVAASRKRIGERRPAPKKIAMLAAPALGPNSVYEPLPQSRKEVEEIARLVPPQDVFLALGAQANRQTALSSELGRYQIVHFATHGLLRDLPDLSGLVLSEVDEQGRPQNGFLHSYEIYDLTLPAELVVLSACETGLEEEKGRGEGVGGMARAFLHAGAKRVLVSLWSVDDTATSELMQRFYQGHLRQGLSPAAALRAAQRSMIERSIDPYYWAGFVLQGEWR